MKYVQGFIGPEGRPVGAVGRPLDSPSVIVTRTGGVKLATLPRARRETSVDERRRDLYGLGAISWSLLADQPVPDDAAELLRSGTRLGLPDEVPDTLVTVIERCLSREVSDPPLELDELIAKLALVLGQSDPLPVDETRRLVAEARTSLRPSRRRPRSSPGRRSSIRRARPTSTRASGRASRSWRVSARAA